MSTNIKLPLNTKPIIQTYSDIANHLSIISNSSYFKEWYYSNITVQISYAWRLSSDYKEQIYHEVVMGNPIIYTTMTTNYEDFYWQNIILNKIELLEYLKNKLNTGHYIVVHLNERYVLNTIRYHNQNFLHRELLFGYTEDDGCFYLIGHNKYKHYSECKISFDDLTYGFFSIENNSPITLIQLNNINSYEYDWCNMANDFTEYIETKVDDMDANKCFNFEAMKNIKDVFVKMKNCEYTWSNSGRTYKDSRIIATLKDQKNVIMDKLLFFNDMGVKFDDANLLNRYSEVCHTADICEKLFLKYRITDDGKVIDKINSKIDFIIEQENELIPQIIKGLVNYLDKIKWNKTAGFNER